MAGFWMDGELQADTICFHAHGIDTHTFAPHPSIVDHYLGRLASAILIVSGFSPALSGLS